MKGLKLAVEENGLWICIEIANAPYVSNQNPGPVINLPLLLPPLPPTNPDQTQQPQNYGTAVPYQPVMPSNMNDGYAPPMINMNQTQNNNGFNYYTPTNICQPQHTYEEPNFNGNQNNLQLQDDMEQIHIQANDHQSISSHLSFESEKV